MIQKRGYKTDAIRTYLKKHPNATYREFAAATKIQTTDAVFYTQRKKLRESGSSTSGSGNGLIPPNFRVQNKLRSRYETLAKYLKSNSQTTYEVMIKELGLKMHASTFHRFKKRCLEHWGNGKGTAVKAPKATKRVRGMYRPIFTTDSSRLSEAAKKLLMQFVEALNESKAGLYEVKEYRQPRELEVREVE